MIREELNLESDSEDPLANIDDPLENIDDLSPSEAKKLLKEISMKVKARKERSKNR